VLAMLLRPEGTSLAEVMEAIGWTERNAYEGVRLCRFRHGYGLRQDETGLIHAFRPPS